jgi:mRNA deadenylase 3'-5' endonuclease subunit Ccr4
MPFTLATYNVLATAYLGRGDYSAVAPGLLEPERRTAALVRHVIELGAGILCLQEVEADVFGALREGLAPLGHEGCYEWKAGGKPDGCATFFRAPFTLKHAARLEYRDDEKGQGRHSGFVALLLALGHDSRTLGVANTHLRWDKPRTPRAEQVGHRQAAELIGACGRFEPRCDGWVVCGDFNRGPESEVAATFRSAGFALAHESRPHARSAVANRKARLIDHLFHTAALAALPIDPPEVDDETVLPSEDEPSDHLALAAEFEWVGSSSGS